MKIEDVIIKISDSNLDEKDISFIELNKFDIFDYLFNHRRIDDSAFKFFIKDSDFRNKIIEYRFIPGINSIRILIELGDEELLLFLSGCTKLDVDNEDLLEMINSDLKRVARDIVLKNEKFHRAVFLLALMDAGIDDEEILSLAMNHLSNTRVLEKVCQNVKPSDLSINNELINYLIDNDLKLALKVAEGRSLSYEVFKKFETTPKKVCVEYSSEVEEVDSFSKNIVVVNAPLGSKFRVGSILFDPKIATEEELFSLRRSPAIVNELMRRRNHGTIKYLNSSNLSISKILDFDSSKDFIHEIVLNTKFKYAQEVWGLIDLSRIDDLCLKMMISLSLSKEAEFLSLRTHYPIQRLVEDVKKISISKIRVNVEELPLGEEEVKLLATSPSFSITKVQAVKFDYSDLYKLTSTGAFLKAFKDLEFIDKVKFIEDSKTSSRYLEVILKNILSVGEVSQIDSMVSAIFNVEKKRLSIPSSVIQFLSEETIFNNIELSKKLLDMSSKGVYLISNVMGYVDLLYEQGYSLSDISSYLLRYSQSELVDLLGDRVEKYGIKLVEKVVVDENEVLDDLSNVKALSSLKEIKCARAKSSELLKVIGKKCYVEVLEYDMMINLKLSVQVGKLIIGNYKVKPSIDYIVGLSPKTVEFSTMSEENLDLAITLSEDMDVIIDSLVVDRFKSTDEFLKMEWSQSKFDLLNKHGYIHASDYQKLINLGKINIIEYYLDRYGETPFYVEGDFNSELISRLLKERKIFKSKNVANIIYSLEKKSKDFSPINCSALSLDEKNELIDHLSLVDERLLEYKKMNVSTFSTIVPYESFVDIRKDENFSLLRVSPNMQVAVKKYCLIAGDHFVAKVLNYYRICDHFSFSADINDILMIDGKSGCEEKEKFSKISANAIESMLSLLDTPVLMKAKKKNLMKFLTTATRSSNIIPDIGGMYRQLSNRLKLREEGEQTQELEKQLLDIMSIDDAEFCHNRLVNLEIFVSRHNSGEKLGMDKYFSLESQRFDDYTLYFPRQRADLIYLGTEHAWCVKNNDGYGDRVIKNGNVLVGVCEGESSRDNVVALCNLNRHLDGSFSLEQIRWSQHKKNGKSNVCAKSDIDYKQIIKMVSNIENKALES